MAYAVLHGPSCLDSKHVWVPASGVATPAIHDRQTDPATLPWTKLEDVPGWSDLPEQIISSAGRTNSVGEVPYPPRILGRTFIYTCEARAVTREQIAALRTGFLNGFGSDPLALTATRGVMTVTPYSAPGGQAWTFSAVVIDFKGDPGFSYFQLRRAPYRWKFAVHLRLSDPRFYAVGSLTPKL